MNPNDYVMATDYKAFKNNNIYTGSFTISGTIGTGVNTRTYTLPVGKDMDMADVQFRGVGTSVGRPTDAWFNSGPIDVNVTGPGMSSMPFFLNSRVQGTNIIITATTMNQTMDTYTASARTVNVRVVDYSIQ